MAADPAPRTPVTVFLVVVNLGLYLSLGMVLGRPERFILERGEREAPVVVLETAMSQEILETAPIDEPEIVSATLGDPRFNSDAAFEGQGMNSAIGVGGGAGGAFGGRRAGVRHLRLQGGAVAGAPALPDAVGTSNFEFDEERGFTRPFGEGVLSTFSVDVDTASWSLVRRFIAGGQLPPNGAVRVEEMINAFRYDDAPPRDGNALAARVDAATCPWEARHRLVRVALKGRVVEEAVRPAANLVFLVDVSGSMHGEDRLPLVKTSVRLLLEKLDARDRVAIVVYAGCEGLALPSTAAGDRAPIHAALDRLESGGSTNGGAGIGLAYRIAEENFIRGGINRVILATDGDFNVGVTGKDALVDLIAKKAEGGVNLSVLGYGEGNLNDAMMVKLADRGNGNYGYIADLQDARRVLVEEGLSNLMVVAKDAKIQVEWNPRMVAGWRLVGYEKRHLKAEDFRDERKDAGEVGVGHGVTAFYEVVPFGGEVPGSADDPGYVRTADVEASDALLTVRVRWKEPVGEAVTEFERTFTEAGITFEEAPVDFRFGAAVALFGMILRDSPHAGSGNLDLVREIALASLGADPDGRRAGFVAAVEKAQSLGK